MYVRTYVCMYVRIYVSSLLPSCCEGIQTKLYPIQLCIQSFSDTVPQGIDPVLLLSN